MEISSSCPFPKGFTTRLPKAELHAHLTGSISVATLHDIWMMKSAEGKLPFLGLEDPCTAIPVPTNDSIDVQSFFPLFDKYIYNLVNNVSSVRHATRNVLNDFAKDGVRLLELRTTPRKSASISEGDEGMTKADYVYAVLEVIGDWNAIRGEEMEVYLILSIDRKMSAKEGVEVVELAKRWQYSGYTESKPFRNWIVGVDLCGNPMRPIVSESGFSLQKAFMTARAANLGVTVHFAETPESATYRELSALLSLGPSRLGHAIHIPQALQEPILERNICLELCLSCNVLASLTQGGFADHHFGYWLGHMRRHDGKGVAIALSTDDVGIFKSKLSEEYSIAAMHFGLDQDTLVELAWSATTGAFAGRDRMRKLIRKFAETEGICHPEERLYM